MRSRGWCFTHYFEDESTWPSEKPEEAIYLVYGFEVCPQTKRPHLQGYIYWINDHSMSQCCAWFPQTGFIKAGGTPDQNRIYCTKDNDYIEFGECPKQGKRSDLMSAKADMDAGASPRKMWEEHFSTMIRYHKSISVYSSIRSPKRSWKTICFLIVGPSGKAKTTLAHILARVLGDDIFIVPAAKGSGLYFDGYAGHSIAILDEMDGSAMKPTFFNGLVDKFEYSVPIHGSANVNWCPRYLFITSNYLPKYWWKGRTPLQQEQTYRRIEVIIPRLRPVPPAAPPPPPPGKLPTILVDQRLLKERLKRQRTYY